MGYLTEKVAYLKGLADGMQIDTSTNEGKLFTSIIDVLDELAESMEDMNEEVIEAESRIDDLEDFASDILEDCGCDCDDCDCDDYDDCDCDCDCDDCDCDDCDCDDLDFYEVECPHCGEKVYFDEDMIDQEDLVCPNCDGVIEIDFDAEDFEDEEEQ